MRFLPPVLITCMLLIAGFQVAHGTVMYSGCDDDSQVLVMTHALFILSELTAMSNETPDPAVGALCAVGGFVGMLANRSVSQAEWSDLDFLSAIEVALAGVIMIKGHYAEANRPTLHPVIALNGEPRTGLALNVRF